jgi:hypothetical protein
MPLLPPVSAGPRSNRPAVYRTSVPPSVPTQSVPSRPTRSELMRFSRKASVSRLEKTDRGRRRASRLVCRSTGSRRASGCVPICGRPRSQRACVMRWCLRGTRREGGMRTRPPATTRQPEGRAFERVCRFALSKWRRDSADGRPYKKRTSDTRVDELAPSKTPTRLSTNRPSTTTILRHWHAFRRAPPARATLYTGGEGRWMTSATLFQFPDSRCP